MLFLNGINAASAVCAIFADRRITKLRTYLSLVAWFILSTQVSTNALAQNLPEEASDYLSVLYKVSFRQQPIRIYFGRSIYNIPRNYLASVVQSDGTNAYAAFTLYVLLPDLAPRTPENSATLDRPGWHDQLRALVQYGKVPRPSEELLRFYLHVSKIPESDFRIVGNRYRLYERPHNVPHEIYATDTPNGLLLFTCNSEDSIRVTPACTVMESLGQKVGITYSFSREHLLEAADIDTKLRALIDSFTRE